MDTWNSFCRGQILIYYINKTLDVRNDWHMPYSYAVTNECLAT